MTSGKVHMRLTSFKKLHPSVGLQSAACSLSRVSGSQKYILILVVCLSTNGERALNYTIVK